MNSKIEPFTGPMAGCPKCGCGSGNPPNPRFVPQTFVQSSLRVRYCLGGKEPEENAAEPVMELLQQIFMAAADKLRAVTVKRLNICAGITEEHLHVTCVDCGHEWLTQTKEQHKSNTKQPPV